MTVETQTGQDRPGDRDGDGDGDSGDDALVRAVRRQLGIGVLLPLGDPADGAWITEQAVAGVLRRAARGVAGVRLGTLRVTAAEAGAVRPSGFPVPPGALPPGPLRCAADLAAALTPGALPHEFAHDVPHEPLYETADRLRAALWAVSEERLGLEWAAIDLRVTDVLPGLPPEESGAPGEAEPASGRPAPSDPVRAPAPSDPVRAAALAVPGVAREHAVLAGGRDPAARVQFAVAGGHRASDVARAVREAVGPAPVAVVVTAVDPTGVDAASHRSHRRKVPPAAVRPGTPPG
ncbi:nucleopolyhedrovirus P10 family protein [Streptomyces sp. URMC 126]|uniref:nucleopolyhedrovirus P10 family protein n=1 Tax=Streptomyces sp. URMC 126 TaxID=3423401 RepID=UPI003F1CFFBD